MLWSSRGCVSHMVQDMYVGNTVYAPGTDERQQVGVQEVENKSDLLVQIGRYKKRQTWRNEESLEIQTKQEAERCRRQVHCSRKGVSSKQ